MYRSDRAIILMYHSISEGTGYAWAVTPKAFEQQMAYLAATGRPVIPLAELVRRVKAREPLMGAVVITFDDGYRDNLDTALPILERYRFPATIFVPTDLLGHPSKYGIERFSREDIPRLTASGLISIEPHSLTHPMLTRIPAARAKEEIEASKAATEALTGTAAACFSYPYGDFNGTVSEMVREAGYGAAVAVRAADVRPDSGRFALPRYALTERTTLATFRGILADSAWRRAFQYASGYRPRFDRVIRVVQRLWAIAEGNEWSWIARPLFRLVPRPERGPLMLDEGTVGALRRGKAAARAARASHPALREDMVSIGVFAYDRFDLLQRTAAALAAYLAEYGDTFRHEIILFHDGPNDEIRAWAQANPLFDRVIMNDRNRGLSYNINRFWYEESRGDFILNLEDDWVCEYKDNFILNALDILASDADVGCVSFERRAPDDYRVWNRAVKIESRVLSARVYETPRHHHRYRLLPKSSYGNSCTLYRFSSLALAGRLPDGSTRRRGQEGQYIRRYSRLWMGARGISQKDNPFLHIGDGRSSPTWKL